MGGDERDTLPPELENAPLPNRITRGTLTGCLGILCVFALPILLFLPLENLHASQWIARLAPLIAVAITVVGAWLLARVPAGSGAAPRSSDPRYPLTSAGLPPIIEQPTKSANRTAFGAALLLIVLCLIGYGVVSADSANGRGILAGTLLTSAGGGSLLAYSLLAMSRRVPIPAWRWVRLPIHDGLTFQPVPFALVGFIATVWALLVAAGQGYFWAPVGVGLLILGGALTGPILQRLPNRPARQRDLR